MASCRTRESVRERASAKVRGEFKGTGTYHLLPRFSRCGAELFAWWSTLDNARATTTWALTRRAKRGCAYDDLSHVNWTAKCSIRGKIARSAPENSVRKVLKQHHST